MGYINIQLSWISAQNAISYNVYYATTSGVTIETGIPIVDIQDISYLHTGLLNDTTYYYIVAGVDYSGNIGPASIEFSATTPSVLVSIAITPSSPSVNVGSTIQFTATGTYANSSTADITNSVFWSSSSPSNATIGGTGLATGILHGSTEIGASLDSISATPVALTVDFVLSSISVSPTSPTITTTQTQQFTAIAHYNDGYSDDITDSATWLSGSPSIVTIDSSTGLASGVSVGSAGITAELDSVDGYTTISITAGIPFAGLLHWVKADAGVVVDGYNNVISWADQSGNNTNWEANVGDVVLVSNQQNGLPIIRNTNYDISTYLSQAPFISGSSDGELFVMIKSLESGTNYGFSQFGPNNGSPNHYAYGGTDIYDSFGLSGRFLGPVTPSPSSQIQNYGILNFSTVGGVLTAYLNGTLLGTSGGAEPRLWDPSVFTLFGMAGISDISFHGDIGELLVYNEGLSSGDRSEVLTYLSSRWGL